MNTDSCPDWICNHQGTPYDYVYFLTTVIASIPYLLFVIYLFKKINFSKTNRYLVLFGISIGYVFYAMVLFFAFLDSENEIISFIGLSMYGPLIVLMPIVLFLIIGVGIVILINFIKKSITKIRRN